MRTYRTMSYVAVFKSNGSHAEVIKSAFKVYVRSSHKCSLCSNGEA